MKRGLAITLAALVVLSSVGIVAAASTLNFDADATPNPRIEQQQTKAVHNMSWDSPLTYEDNNGDLATLNAEVNQSYDNPFSYVPSDVAFADGEGFPHEKDSVSALDASEWTTGSGSISDVNTAPGVPAVELSATGLTSGGSETFTMSNFSVTSDQNKRYLQFIADVGTLDGTIEVRAVDSDGDYYSAEFNASSSDGENWAGGSTGEGFVFQKQLGEMTLDSTNGDGSFDDIESVEVVVQDGDGTLSLSALNVESMSPWTLGDSKTDTDGDGDLETTTVTEKSSAGALEITSLDTLGSAFENAEIYSLGMWLNAAADDLPSDDITTEFSQDTEDVYPSFYGTATIYYEMGTSSVPDQYDLTPSSMKLVDEQSVPASRVISVEYAEGVDESTGFENMTWTDKSGLYTEESAVVTIDETLQPGDERVVKYTLKLKQSAFEEMQQSTAGGGMVAGQQGGPLSALVNWFMGIPGTIATFIGGFLGTRKLQQMGG